MESGSKYRGFPCEDEGRASDLFPYFAERASPADDDEQVIAKHGGRERERKRGECVERIFAAKLFVRQKPGEPDARGNRNQSGNGSHFEAQPQGKPVDRHERFLDCAIGGDIEG